jgi:regulator of protease activity HflC (stomatin/prohibitin superfamily)
MSAPFVTKVLQVTTRTETDTLEPVRCISKDGIQNTFYKIQVMSRIFGVDFKRMLIYDRIAEELRTFCARREIDQVYNTEFLEIVGEVKSRVMESIIRLGNESITIYNLVIPKPDIPPDIAFNYKQVKVQWTEQLVATQKQKTALIHKETEAMKAIQDAERQKEVLKINIMKNILEKEGQMNSSLLNNEIMRAAEETKANNEFYKSAKEAEANTKLYSKEYVQMNLTKSLTNNTKIYFSGENSLFGKILQQVLANSQ